MRFSSRFFVVPSFSRVYVTVMNADHESSFVPATVIGRDISQSGKIRELVCFDYNGTPYMALVYPYLPMVALYHGGDGKRYMDCECWGQYPKGSQMQILTKLCYENIPR